MQQELLSSGWYLQEIKNCCGSYKERYMNNLYSGITITIIPKKDMFIVRRQNRTIYTSYATNLKDYISKLIH